MSLSRADMEEIEERAIEAVVDVLTSVVDEMIGPDGLVYGDESLSDAEYVEFWLDLEARGVTRYLALMPGGHYERMLRRAERAMEKMMGLRDAPRVREVAYAR